MKYHFVNIKVIICFSRWTRKSYAIFNSLNKIIKISGLSIVMLAMGLPVSTIAQTDTTNSVLKNYDLDEVEIVEPELLLINEVPSRVIRVIKQQDVESAPIESIQDILTYISQTDIRQRGINDIQADISIRGGTFDQVLIMLNGVNITNPQTGHHNLDLPVSFDQIQRIEILNGAGSQSFGANAYSGVINIITTSHNKNVIRVKAVGGSFNMYNLSGSINLVKKKFRHLLAINKDGSKGYITNTDYSRTSFYYSGKYLLSSSFFEWQISAAQKAFGAHSFYTAKYPNQFEKTETSLASLKFQSYGKVNTKSHIYWHLHSDRFELFRDYIDSPVWYSNHNYHLTNVAGGNAKVSFSKFFGKTTFGIDVRHEQIASNVLGIEISETVRALFNSDGFYNKRASRTNYSISVEQKYEYKKISTVVALMVNTNTSFSNSIKWYPGLDVSYCINKKWKLISSVNRSLRLPTFTDLYYSGPSNIGNPNLKPEDAINIDWGLSFNKNIVKADLTIFNNYGFNSIDWVRKSDTMKWQPMNITKVKTYGVDTKISFNIKELAKRLFVNNISLQYTYINKETNSVNYESHYVLDYLKNKFVMKINHEIYKNISLTWSLCYNHRNGNYFLLDQETNTDILSPYGDYTLLDTRIYYKSKSKMIFIDVKNIFNKQYFDFGNVIQPGCWFFVGIRWDFYTN